MSQDPAVLENNIKEFIDQVIETGVVWGLTNEEGWASSESIDDEENSAIAFWSNEEGCKACAKEGWSQYKPATITLSDFLENWCIGMYHDYCLAGLNWDASLLGIEVEPLELAMEILEQVEEKGKTLEFKNHKNQEDLKLQIQQVLDQDNG